MEIRRAAMDLLARREHSTFELRQKLRGKGFDRELMNGVLGELARDGLVDDRRFVEVYCRARAERGYGPLRVQSELRQRGVDEAVIAKQLNARDERWEQRANEVRMKRFGEAVPRDSHQRAKQIRFLEYRGFSSDQIRRAFASGRRDD